ncbi:MAG TPA: hypothetical protein VI357_03935 [Mycobacteriales bacterium]
MATSLGRPGWSRRRISAGSAIALVGVLVAIGAWRWPVDPSPAPPAPPTPSTTPSTTPTTPTPPTGTPTTTPVSGPHRFLTELVPSSGGSAVQRSGSHSLIMKCGTGESDDRDREVSYDIPPTGYRTLTAILRPTGRRETRVQVSVLADGVLRTNPVLTAGTSRSVAVDVDGAGHLILRITCDVGATSTTFVDPVLTG